MNIKTLFLILLSIIYYSLNSQAQERKITELNTNWKFFKGHSEKAYEKGFDDSKWKEIRVPHDWAVESPFIVDGDGNTGKLGWKGEGWYRKALDVSEKYRGKKIYLIFDGIMAFPKIYINGKLAGHWDYGYNSFYLDVTDFVDFNGENILAIHVDTREHDSRWYPGAGIYRKIQLLAVNPIHVDIWGTYITTPVIKPHYSDVRITTSINNNTEGGEEVMVIHIIRNAGKNVILEKTINAIVYPQKENVLETTIIIPNPKKWDIDDPHLYSLETQVYLGKSLMDTYHSTFGIRDIRFTSDNGFFLNDRRVQLKGVNLHHDHGPLGAAFNRRAMQRQLEIMKDMGVNSIRTSHNTAAPELLDLCDEMGLLVFNEVFDKYDAKADILEDTNFEEFAQRNIRNFVVRDRNHPCIFLWSVGNEIGNVQWNIDNGFYKLKTMINYLEKYDDTRPNTLVCDNLLSAEMRHFDYYDVHCWNYGRRYRLARQLEPNKSVIISESASTLSTRGFYELPLPAEKTDFTRSLQVSSYDLNAPDWAEIADDDFMWQQDEPYIAGEFIWTGFDYLGEPTPYNNKYVIELGMTDVQASRSSYFGVVDLCGIPKDRFYLYKSYWKPEETTIHILPHWNWPERLGKNVPVFVYTNGDCAELFLNGKSLGRQCKNPKSKNSVERFRLMWNDVIYQPGELKAVAYKEGIVIGDARMKTAGSPARLRLSPDRKTITADGKDLSYILVEAIDKDGNLCPLANEKIQITLSGPGFIAGVGNGNPQSFHPFKSNSVPLFYGKAMIIVGSEKASGQIRVKVESGGILGGEVELVVR